MPLKSNPDNVQSNSETARPIPAQDLSGSCKHHASTKLFAKTYSSHVAHCDGQLHLPTLLPNGAKSKAGTRCTQLAASQFQHMLSTYINKLQGTARGGCPIFLHLESGLAPCLRELAHAQFGSKWLSSSLITLTR